MSAAKTKNLITAVLISVLVLVLVTAAMSVYSVVKAAEEVDTQYDFIAAAPKEASVEYIILPASEKA